MSELSDMTFFVGCIGIIFALCFGLSDIAKAIREQSK